MKFFTAVQIPEYQFGLSYHDKVLLIGSCFTENIAANLKYRKFNTCENPFGILYNPNSIYRSLIRIANGEMYSEKDLLQFDGLYHSFDHHGSFSATDPAEVVNNINGSMEKAGGFLKDSNLLIVTFGTSYVYERKTDSYIVANCHKVPDAEFSRRLLSVDEIVKGWDKTYNVLQRLNPGLKIIVTVSPVRHFRDGMTANQRSKATLVLAAHKISDSSPNNFYFPSYEIMMDELRDYRFYEEDMVHPSKVAMQLIWEKFAVSVFTDETRSMIKKIESVCKAKEHRAFRPETEEYKAFAANQIRKIETLLKDYPFLDMKDEEKFFRKSI